MKFNLIPVQKIDSVSVKNAKVYDLTVEENHSYCVDKNIAVHNSNCLTRKKAGVGFPQLSTVIECSQEAHSHGAYLMSDGGCTCPGDVAKALVAGADFVMVGGMLAGHDECELDFSEDDTGNRYAYSYGMSSHHAMNKHFGGVEEYRTSEGKVVKIPARGAVKNTIQDILGGLRSCGTYINAREIKDFAEQGQFIKVNRQLSNYFSESHTVSN